MYLKKMELIQWQLHHPSHFKTQLCLCVCLHVFVCVPMPVSSQRELISLWYELQKDRPELLSVLEGILIHAVSQLQDCIRERDSLEQALRRSSSSGLSPATM